MLYPKEDKENKILLYAVSLSYIIIYQLHHDLYSSAKSVSEMYDLEVANRRVSLYRSMISLSCPFLEKMKYKII